MTKQPDFETRVSTIVKEMIANGELNFLITSRLGTIVYERAADKPSETSRDGRKELDVLVRDVVKEKLANGSLDSIISEFYEPPNKVH